MGRARPERCSRGANRGWRTPARRVGLCALLSAACTSPEASAFDDAPRPRIVSLVPAATAILIALDAADHIVGRTADDRAPEIAHRPSVGRVLSPSLEDIAALRPDVVLAWADANLGVLRAVVTGAGATLLPLRLERVADVAEACRQIAAVVGLPAQGVELAQEIELDLRTVREAAARVPPVRVLWVVWQDPPIAAGPGTHLDDLLRIAGAVNVLADAGAPWPRPSFETLVFRAPDVVVWPEGPGLGPPDERLARTPWWALSAVRDGRVVRVDADLFFEAGPHVPRAAATLATALHPELAAKLSPLLTHIQGSPR